MTDILLDQTTNDVVVVDGDISFVPTQQELTRQAVVMSLKTYKGEWFRDINYGVPWITNDNNDTAILGKATRVFFDQEIRKVILANPEVTGIVSFKSSVEPKSGRVTLKAELSTDSGNILIETPIDS